MATEESRTSKRRKRTGVAFDNDQLFPLNGFVGSITAGNTQNFDIKMRAKTFLTGVHLILNNHAYGDDFNLLVIDKDNVMGNGANFIVYRIVNDWNVTDQDKLQPIIFNPGKPIRQNVYLRIRYTSTGASNVDIRANLYSREG